MALNILTQYPFDCICRSTTFWQVTDIKQEGNTSTFVFGGPGKANPTPLFFKMAQNLDLRCVLVPAPWVLGRGQNTSRIQNKEIYATLCLQDQARRIPAAAPCCPLLPRTTPSPEGNSIPGVLYEVLLGADMNAATPLGA